MRTVASLAMVALVGTALSIGCNRTPNTPNTAAGSQPSLQKPEGASEFRASQHAFQKVEHLTFEQITTTEIGVFKEVIEADCASPYYHSRYTKDLTPKGIESNASQLQGQPRAHQEAERLLVDGGSFDRFTGSWANAPASMDDAHPDWGASRNPYDLASECESFRQSKAIPFVPFDKILAANRIEYQGPRAADGTQCHEFKVTYSDLVDSAQTNTINTGGGASTTYRTQVAAPVESTICLGVGDLLPRQGTKDNVAFKFSYGPIEKLGRP